MRRSKCDRRDAEAQRQTQRGGEDEGRGWWIEDRDGSGPSSILYSLSSHSAFSASVSAPLRLCRRICIPRSGEARADVETAVAAVARGDDAEGAGEVEGTGTDAHGVGGARAEGDG